MLARHAVIARPAMTATAAVQRKPIRLAIIAVGAGRSLTLLLLRRRRLLRWLTAGNERWQPVDVNVTGRRRHMLRARLKMLRLGLRLVLLARIEWLRFARGKRLAAHGRLFVLTVVE